LNAGFVIEVWLQFFIYTKTMDKKTIFISTSIPYVNSRPHIGHTLEFVQADILARCYRLSGNDVFFLSGTDENALKNAQAAAEMNIPVREFVAANAKVFQELIAKLNISNDYFIRTSADKRHLLGAQRLWFSFKEGDVYKKKYRGLYCIGCEEFKLEKELQDGHCSEHPNRELEIIEEENYFFKLSDYQEQIENIIMSDELVIIPESRKNEMLSFIKSGLQDISISRTSKRAGEWGLPVPGDPTQRQYVWVDALSNYITALGYAYDDEKFSRYWQNSDERIHVIGKGINRFHTVYWPAMLISAGIRLPSRVFVHGYVNVGGQKMSKSLGNVVDPFAIIEEYGADALRYYLARHTHPFEDHDFTFEKFKEAYNAHLANGLGNLVSRVMKMAETHLKDPFEVSNSNIPGDLQNELRAFEIQRAIDMVWEHIAKTDRYIQETKPFNLVKEDKKRAVSLIEKLVADLYGIGIMLAPFMPETSEKIKTAVRANRMPQPLFARK
jgi:methionyl-tRNA synthetase